MTSKKQPPKPAVINPIFTDLTSKLWWEYTGFDQFIKDQVDTFFNTYSKDLPLLLTTNLYENVQNLSKLMGLYTHPLFKTQPKYSQNEENQPLIPNTTEDNQHMTVPPRDAQKEKSTILGSMTHNEKNSQINLPGNAHNQAGSSNANITMVQKLEVNFILINNMTVDYATAKILNYVWGLSKFNVLKLNRNNFDDATFLQFQELIMNTGNKLFKLFFEWNVLRNELALPFYTQLSISPSLEYLVLRSNSLTDEIFVPFVEKLTETNNQVLKFLDVYDNLLTKKSFTALGKLLATNRTLECLGLAKNRIESLDDINDILMNIGRHPLSNEEHEEYQNKEKQREAIMERNKKIKKKENQEPLPFLDPIQQISEGKFALVKNLKLSCLNLAKNSFDDSQQERIDFILSNSSENFQLVLNLNPIEEKTADKLRKIHGKKILI